MCSSSRPSSGEQDEVATGAAHNNVLQRMKLNNKVALITGEALPFPVAFKLLLSARLWICEDL